MFWILESVQAISIYRLSVLKNTSVQFQFSGALSPGESIRVISIYHFVPIVDFDLLRLWSSGKNVRVISIYRYSKVLKKTSGWFQFTGTPNSWKKRPGDFNLPLLESVPMISIYQLSSWKNVCVLNPRKRPSDFNLPALSTEKHFRTISIYRCSESWRKHPSDFNLPALSAEKAYVQFQFTGALSLGESLSDFNLPDLSAEKASVQFQFTGTLS